MTNDRSPGPDHRPVHDGPEHGSPDHGSLEAVTIALLDDDMILRLCVETVFEDSSFRIVGGSSPSALLEALRSSGTVPDILVTDHRLGRRGAAPVSVPDVLAAIGRDLPVIVTTGDESTATRAEIRRAGWHFLGKPYDPETLQALVLSALGRAD